MAATSSQEKKKLYKCVLCNTEGLGNFVYISHIKSKRHLKNLKDRNLPQPNDESNRTIQVTGFKLTPEDDVIQVFLKYGVRLVTRTQSAITIEFHSAEGASKALEDQHHCRGIRLHTSPIKFKRHNAGRSSVPVSPRTWSHLRNHATGNSLNQLIYDLISDLEIKFNEYEKREYLTKLMVRFLTPHFPKVIAHMFGSSANNLGFTGCDVDLYVDLGVYPWDPGYTRGESQTYASNLTWYLAREIRKSRRGVQVQAVPRARVPIVKFQETSTGLFVDLSFRHNMPVYNTKLIFQYTKTHSLVRPYMMIIRCWAKIQNIAGGGEPSWLITNYALSLMMLFYLMYRNDPIIPSVASLKLLPLCHNGPYVVDGWDCSFSDDVGMWIKKHHNASVIHIVAEFFEFFSDLDASEWVISPYAGRLFKKADIKRKDLKHLPNCMLPYCQQNTDIQLNTPFCVQDVFELSHNCTRGLKKGPLTEFQYKCKVAAQISRNVSMGTQSLSDLLEVTEVTPAVLENIVEEERVTKKGVVSDQEVITLDDSSASQDSVEILDVTGNDDSSTEEEEVIPVSMKLLAALDNSVRARQSSSCENGSVKCSDEEQIIMNTSDSEVEVLATADKLDEEVSVIGEMKATPPTSSSAHAAENGLSENDMDLSIGPREFAESVPEKRPLKYVLNFEDIPEFSITFDGAVSGCNNVMNSDDDIAQAACSLTHFVLQQCLKVEVSVMEDFLGSKKRKNFENEEDIDSAKRLKTENGESVSVATKYRRLAQYKCTAEVQLWVGRKKVTKTVPRAVNATPLQHELAITEVQLESQDSCKCPIPIDCLIEVWQKCNNSTYILLTGKSLSENTSVKGNVIQMYSYLTSLVQNLLKKVTQHVHATSTKR
ncbi:hypothetical protein Pmani_011313 [Petrolisthes manimaculis]|uniref:Poly(A) RNA polymerase mitochondrial-like central palm domain-containing protein n=1 Tax=Petrolisthes manimaculis TaxID=1843537 RepID=A0AAE1Q0Y6_9EUCA|nr:hypothetical protein Pmani_011313 [Petrolisthes manimaculis]